MAPTNRTSDGCNLPANSTEHSPKLTPAGNVQSQDVSTISRYYKLEESRDADDSINHVNISAVPHTRLEIEESITKRYKLCSKPCSCNHDIKKYMQSYQALPAKTRQTLRVLVIALVSVVALVAIFYVARQSKHQEENDLLEQNLEQKLHLDINNGDRTSGQKILDPKLEYEVENEDIIYEGNPNPPKLKKDHSGKSHYYDELPINDAVRHPKIPKATFDIARLHIRKGIRHPANATEISTTLELVRRIVDADRKLISNKELKFWEAGSEPLRIILLSTWRSGSTFLAQILQSHPGVFEHYEPFSYTGVRQIRSGKEAFQSQQMLHGLLDCKYKGLDAYNNYTKHNLELMVGYNKRVWSACKSGPNVMTCAEPEMLSAACKMFPIQLVKTVRLRLNITQLLLNDHKLNVKVIYLVRDPRGTMSSRYSSVSWCSESTDCSSPEALCQDLQDDLKVATAFEKLYPNRFLKVQYEDLSTNADQQAQKIVDYLGLEYTKEMKNFVVRNTEVDFDKPWSIKRKSIDRISLWKKKLPLEEIHAVQNACEHVLKSMKFEIL